MDLQDYSSIVFEDKGMMENYHDGMMEQVICANAYTFLGSVKSSFTGYITRLRGEISGENMSCLSPSNKDHWLSTGYYRDGRYARTYYITKEDRYQ